MAGIRQEKGDGVFDSKAKGTKITSFLVQISGNCCIEYSPTIAPDGWEVNSSTCAANCNTAATCNSDYVIIPNANINGRGTTLTRFCGDELSIFATVVTTPVVSCSNPFRLYFHSIPDGNQGNDRGFSLIYRQLPC